VKPEYVNEVYKITKNSYKMSDFRIVEDCPKYDPTDPTDPANGQKQIYVQLVLSLALGVSAFLGFCVSLIVISYIALHHTDSR